MRLNTNYTGKPLCLVIVLFTILCSCKIEDDHGTLEHILNIPKYNSQHGDFLADIYVESEFFENPANQELYFIGCQSNYGYCNDPNSYKLFVLDHELNEIRSIRSIDDNFGFLFFTPSTQKLYFKSFNVNDYSWSIVQFDPISRNEKEILNIPYDPFLVAINEQFIFLNYEYDQYNILKFDFSGNSEQLDVFGEVHFAVPGKNEIIVYEMETDNTLLYDYVLKSTVATNKLHYISGKYYSYAGSIYYLYYNEFQYIKNFITNEILFSTPPYTYILDFNPICARAACIEDKVISHSGYYEKQNTKITIIDKFGEIHNTKVDLYDEWIEKAKILNDGTTIIYSSMGKIYKTTLE